MRNLVRQQADAPVHAPRAAEHRPAAGALADRGQWYRGLPHRGSHLGGVDTDGLSSATMASKHAPGLYFIGEVADVTGWLGGYNFQWAWASGHAAGLAA
ncbi:NAD(P)/FAD-dependent oxidoreductase [Arenimonas daejeonensis]|uniref:NAD(P)/FAD-dependent oxidoreductase n=1 Tax=Arenimonas daejeonensis TaxID=370777 RepID=UPI003CCCA1F5